MDLSNITREDVTVFDEALRQVAARYPGHTRNQQEAIVKDENLEIWRRRRLAITDQTEREKLIAQWAREDASK